MHSFGGPTVNGFPNDIPLETIPPPERVREALGRTVRRADLLRRLLRVSERAAQVRRIEEGSDTEAKGRAG
jgi:hypothetical protein